MGKGTGFGKTILIGDQFVLDEVPAIVSAISYETVTTVERIEGEGWVLEYNRIEVPGYKEKKKEQQVDRVFVYQSAEVRWDVASALRPLGALATVHDDLARLTQALVAEARPGDHLVLMSNGSFGGLHDRLLAALRARAPAPA